MVLPLFLASVLALAAATAAAENPQAAELRRGMAAAGLKTSVEPARRAEPGASAAFLTGAALRAWRNAQAQLDYDLATPSGDGDDTEAIAGDCRDEAAAFAALEAGAAGAALAPEAVAQLAADAGAPQAWFSRRLGPPRGCR